MPRILTVPVTLSMPLSEVEAIEAAAKSAGLSRASWCKQALRAALEQVAHPDEFFSAANHEGVSL